MNCVVLAGGRGERLWPLSRKDLPKQFIQIQKNHSIFQETIARNMAYCDEFIIVTNYDYRSAVSNQMEAFQGITYRCIYEEEPRHTTAAITLACLDLQPSEYVFVVPANHLVDTGECEGLNYKDAILEAKNLAQENRIVLFGIEASAISKRFGYFTGRGETFIEKPDEEQAEMLKGLDAYQNVGMLLFQGGVFLNELRRLRPALFDACRKAYRLRKKDVQRGVLYEAKVLNGIEAISVENCVIEPSEKKVGLPVGFGWSDIGRLEDLQKTEAATYGTSVVYGSEGTEVINRDPDQTVVVNGLDDTIVVNTPDAIYVGKKGQSYKLKDIFRENEDVRRSASYGPLIYREWGYREDLARGEGFLLRRINILPGGTIYEHSHDQRCENWTIIEGSALITIDGNTKIYHETENAGVTPGVNHQISNPGDKMLVLIETVTGENINDSDMRSVSGRGVTEKDLGFIPDPVVRLSPAFKDYLWGGTRLRDLYNKKCDYDIIAESWELSAHPAGNSIIASGRHKGLTFTDYIEKVGKDILGWKCAPLQSFPILIKLIDAKQNLSVQVHPGDDYALANENEYGKNEMWYVIDSEPGAGLYVGFSRDVSREEVAERVSNNTIMDVLNFYPTKPGDVFFIPAGTVHAIGAGNLICEIQQSSNCTYRLYDYDRRDKFGNPRELHLSKALDVLSYDRYVPEGLNTVTDALGQKQIRCKYFETTISEVDGSITMQLDDDSFHAMVCIRGSGTVEIEGESVEISAGESIFIPASKNPLIVKGQLSVVTTKI